MRFSFRSRRKDHEDSIVLWSRRAVFHAQRGEDGIHAINPFTWGNTPRSLKTLTVVFESEAGIPIDERLVWIRERPHDPITLAEMRAVLHELAIRARERLRREGWGNAGLLAAPMQRQEIRLDGKKVLNPVGFSGRTLTVLANQLWLREPPSIFLRELHERLPRASFSSCFVDDVASRLFASLSSDLVLLLQDRTTVVTKYSRGMHARRSICAIGQDSISDLLVRQLGLSSSEEAKRLLRALNRGDLSKPLERNIEKVLASGFLVWGRMVADAFFRQRGGMKSPETLLFLALHEFLPPFQRGLSQKVFERMFPRIQSATCHVATVRDAAKIPEGQSESDEVTWLWAAERVLPSIPTEFAL